MARLSLLEAALLSYGIHFPDHTRKWWLHAQLRKWTGVAPNREFEVVRQGLRWVLNPADFAQESLFWIGEKDRWELHALKRLVSPGDVILDVGANFGYYALTLARKLEGKCTIHALEPDPENFQRLCSHITLNALSDTVKAHCLGVSDGAATVTMSRHPANSGHTAVVSDGEIKNVRLIPLDVFCEEAKLDRLDAVILDVEGLEERALRGAAQTLTRYKPLVMVELFSPVMACQGSSPAAAIAVLSGLGYRLFAPKRRWLRPLTSLPAGDHRINVFALHPENSARWVLAGRLIRARG